jgi:hypothetical protein
LIIIDLKELVFGFDVGRVELKLRLQAQAQDDEEGEENEIECAMICTYLFRRI